MYFEQNDLAYWYPKLASTDVLTPKTKILHTDVELGWILDGKIPKGYDDFVARLTAAAGTVAIAGYPIFLRTGHTSGKHSWDQTCSLRSPDDIPLHVFSLIEWSAIAHIAGLPTDTWAVREMMPVAPYLIAFHGGMPIGKERRFFIRDGHVQCHHPYWPHSAIRQPVSLSPSHGWEEALQSANEVAPIDLDDLTSLSTDVAKVFEGYWSLDWLATGKGWTAIDMARGEDSWHWPECPFTNNDA